MDAVGNVADLYRFPVKSMQGERVDRLELTADGAIGDRIFGVVDVGTGKVLSAKRTAALLEASAVLDDDKGTVTITLPDGSTHAAGDPDTDKALSAWLDRDVELRRPGTAALAFELLMDPIDDESEVWDFATPPGSMVDLAGAHLITSSALAAATALAPDATWSVHRFRPTAVVDTGDAEGFVEDGWVGSTVTLGGAALDVFMLTSRCSLPPRAQRVNGLPRDTAITRALTDHHGYNLGVYCSISAPGAVAIGDPVAVGAAPT